MDRSGKYQTIEYLRFDNEHESRTGIEYESEAIQRSPSSLSSSPPREFDVNIESQYVPIFEEDVEDYMHQDETSIVSSLSVTTEPDPTTSALVLEPRSSRLIRCPACDKPLRTYYCSRCIQRGDFITVGQPASIDDFYDLKLRKPYFTPIPSDQSNPPTDRKIEEETLKFKLRSLIRKNEALKAIYTERKIKLDETKKSVIQAKKSVEIERKLNKSLENKIDLIKKYVSSRKASVKKRQGVENDLLDDMKQHVSRKVYQLTQDVFPIEEINLLDPSNSFVNLETSPLLTFSDGSYHQIEHQTAYSIIEPWLPSNGDYSAYSLWVNDNPDHKTAPTCDASDRNPAFRIRAALALTTQLVQNMASYLDVILPARLTLDTFNRELLDDSQFSYNVAKLNTNIIHLCMTQGVDISLLNSHRTIKNLMLLLNINISDLGRKPIIEIDDEEAAMKIEEQLTPSLSLIQDEFYDFTRFMDSDGDSSDSDWEISVGTSPINLTEIRQAIEQSEQQSSYMSSFPVRLISSLWGT